MNVFGILWAELLSRPIFNLLIVFLAIFWGNMGIAIVLLTILVRLLLLRNSIAGANMSKGMSNIQPKMEALQEKYKDDPKKLSEETMKLLKKEGAGPLKGCLSLLVQLPVFIGLYGVIVKFAAGEVPHEWLYSFFRSFGNSYLNVKDNIDPIFLGMNLFENHNIILAILVAGLNFLQFQLTSLTQAQNRQQTMPNGVKMPNMSNMMGIMNVMMTLMMGTIVWNFASGVGLYLLVTSLFSVVQYVIQYRVLLKAKRDMWFHKDKPVVLSSK